MDKKKLYRYKIKLDYHYIGYPLRVFEIWAYNKQHASELLANKLGMFQYEISIMSIVYIHKYPIYSFFARLFNKVPKKPICKEV